MSIANTLPAKRKLAGLDRLSSIQALPDLELSVVMPCLNEERTVAACVRKGGWNDAVVGHQPVR